MNKNLFRTCIGLAVGGALLVTSTIMGMASGPSGYEALKTAVKNSDRVKNATFVIEGSLMDNNEELMKLSSTLKVEQDELVSGIVSIDADKIDRDYTFSTKDKTMIFKQDSSDVYSKIVCTKKENKSNKRHHIKEYENPQMEAICENILDTLVGDFKNQVTLKNIKDGRKQISINLDKNEIPTLCNLILNLKQDEEHTGECETKDKMSKLFGINIKDFEFPKLVNSIQAEEVNVEIIIDKDSIIKEMDLEFKVSGKDAQNNIHNQELKISFDVSNINSTTADIIDLKGKQVKEISTKEFEYNKK